MKIGVNGTNRNVIANKIGIDGVWRTVKEIKVGIGGAWRTVWVLAKELIRIFTTKADFTAGTLTDVVATDTGDVELSLLEGTTNLLTENQSSIEVDLTGFNKNTGHEPFTRDTAEHWHGSACLRIDISGTSGAEGLFIEKDVISGYIYTFSVYLKGNGKVWVGMGGKFDVAEHNIELTSEWKRYSVTGTASDAGTAFLYVIAENDCTADTIYVDGLQFEQNPYMCPWVLGGTTSQDRYKSTGTIESPAIDLFSAGAAETSKIEFAATTVDMGKAVKFVPANKSRIVIPSFNVPKIRIFARIYPYTTANNSFQVIVSKFVGTGATAGFIKFGHSHPNAGDLRFFICFSDGWAGLETATPCIVANKWHDVEAVYDGNTIMLKVNGTTVASTSKVGIIPDLTQNWSIGEDGFPDGGANALEYFDGIISEVKISEITTEGDVVQGWWKLDEGAGTVANDSSGNGRNGTIKNATWVDGRKTTATVQTALSTDGGTTYGSWQTATSGAAIPGLAAGADVSNTKMKWKAALGTNDTAVTPKLHDVTVKLNEGM